MLVVDDSLVVTSREVDPIDRLGSMASGAAAAVEAPSELQQRLRKFLPVAVGKVVARATSAEQQCVTAAGLQGLLSSSWACLGDDTAMQLLRPLLLLLVDSDRQLRCVGGSALRALEEQHRHRWRLVRSAFVEDLMAALKRLSRSGSGLSTDEQNALLGEAAGLAAALDDDLANIKHYAPEIVDLLVDLCEVSGRTHNLPIT
jgi:hypothetical protein